ncbi:MAG: winged helix-turn-helix domain-containing protein [Acidobacteriota bacterium]
MTDPARHPGSSPPPAALRFGPFELDLATDRLRRQRRAIPLRPQPTRVLRLLAERSDELVTHEQLRDHIWGPDHHGDHAQGLSSCIRQIRSALGDPAEAPRYVKTEPRRGYRFIAPVTTEPLTPAEPPSVNSAAPGGDPAVGGHLRWWVLAVANLLLIALALGFAWSARMLEPAPAEPLPEGSSELDQASEAIAQAVVERLLPATLAPRHGYRPRHGPRPDPAAWESYVHGLALLAPAPSQDVEAGIQALRRAVEIAPEFADAHAALAEALFEDRSRASQQHAMAALRRALELDRDQPVALLLSARGHLRQGLDAEHAAALLDRALMRAPGDVKIYRLRAFARAASGRPEAAIADIEYALQLDPLELAVASDACWIHVFTGASERALELARIAVELAPDDAWGHRCGVLAAWQSGDAAALAKAASREMRYAGAASPAGAPEPAATASAYWRWVLSQPPTGSRSAPTPTLHAVAHLALGAPERALDHLEHSFREREDWLLPFVEVLPALAELRRTARFRQLRPG